MKNVDKQYGVPVKPNEQKWMCTPRLKDIIPLPEGWLEYFFKTVNVIAETGCIEKQCKVADCQKKYKGSNGITSNFAKHVRKNHPVALKRYAEQNHQWNQHRSAERNLTLDLNMKRMACESNLSDLNTSSDVQTAAVNSAIELDSDLSDAYENENEFLHGDDSKCDEDLQQSVAPVMSQANAAQCMKQTSQNAGTTKVNFVNGAANNLQNLNTTAISGSFASCVRNVNLNCTIAPTYRKRKLTTADGPSTSRASYQCDAADSVSDCDELDPKHVTTQRTPKASAGSSSQKCVTANSAPQTHLTTATSLESMAVDSQHLQHPLSSIRLVRVADLARMTSERDRDEMTAFGNLVVSEMRSLAEDRLRDSLKIKIMSLIYETKYGVTPPTAALDCAKPNSSAGASCSSQSTPTGTGSMHQQSNELHFGLDSASHCNNYR